MSDDYQRIEVITGTARRRRWPTEQKLEMVEETLHSGESISAIARRRGVAPNLPYRWRRLMTEGGAVAVQAVSRVAVSGCVLLLGIMTIFQILMMTKDSLIDKVADAAKQLSVDSR